jgi:hypothetical protein
MRRRPRCRAPLRPSSTHDGWRAPLRRVSPVTTHLPVCASQQLGDLSTRGAAAMSEGGGRSNSTWPRRRQHLCTPALVGDNAISLSAGSMPGSSSGGCCLALAGAALGNSDSAIFAAQWLARQRPGGCCLALARAALGNDDSAISPTQWPRPAAAPAAAASP